MDINKAEEIFENYINGNLTDAKVSIKKLSKKELLETYAWIENEKFCNPITGKEFCKFMVRCFQ